MTILEWNGAEEMLPMTLMTIPSREEIVYEDFVRYFQKGQPRHLNVPKLGKNIK